MISGSNLPKHDVATLFLAVSEDNITSSVKAGENSGQTFNHSAVVRSLSAVGAIERSAADFQIRSAFPAISSSQRLVLFVQDNTDRRIIAATSFVQKQKG